jgi:hypothetical protein
MAEPQIAKVKINTTDICGRCTIIIRSKPRSVTKTSSISSLLSSSLICVYYTNIALLEDNDINFEPCCIKTVLLHYTKHAWSRSKCRKNKV